MTDQTRDKVNRYARLGPEARALVDDYDALDLAEMLVKAQDELAVLRAVARGYCPHCGRGDASPTVDDWEQQRQRADRAEAVIARVQALADEYPAGIDTALIEEALDQPGPAATDRTDQLAAAFRDCLAAFNGMRNSDNTGDIQYYQAPRILPTEYERWQAALRPQSRP